MAFEPSSRPMHDLVVASPLPSALVFHETAKELVERTAPVLVEGVLCRMAMLDWRNEAHGIQPGDILEVIGDEGVGKTTLLYQAIISTIAPRSMNGLGSGAVLIDLEHRCDLVKLSRMLSVSLLLAGKAVGLDYSELKAERSTGPTSSTATTSEKVMLGHQVNALVDTCLSRLQVIRPSRPLDLPAALAIVESLYNPKDTHNKSRTPEEGEKEPSPSPSSSSSASSSAGISLPPLRLVVIEGLGAARTQLEGILPNPHVFWHQVMSRMDKILHATKAAILYSKPILFRRIPIVPIRPLSFHDNPKEKPGATERGTTPTAASSSSSSSSSAPVPSSDSSHLSFSPSLCVPEDGLRQEDGAYRRPEEWLPREWERKVTLRVLLRLADVHGSVHPSATPLHATPLHSTPTPHPPAAPTHSALITSFIHAALLHPHPFKDADPASTMLHSVLCALSPTALESIEALP